MKVLASLLGSIAVLFVSAAGCAVMPEAHEAASQCLAVQDPLVTVHDPEAYEVFRAIRRHGGVTVLQMPSWLTWMRSFYRWEFLDLEFPTLVAPPLLIPRELRGTPMRASKLVEAVAAHHSLKVAWVASGTKAIMYRGAPDAMVQRVLADLLADDPLVRWKAAWEAGRVEDIRMIEPLLDALSDPDKRVAESAGTSASRLGLDVVGAVAGEKALPFLEDVCRQGAQDTAFGGSFAIGAIGGQRAFATLQRLMQRQQSSDLAVNALGEFSDDKTLALVTDLAMNTGRDDRPQCYGGGPSFRAFEALRWMRGDRSVLALTKLAHATNATVRSSAAWVLGYTDDARAIPMLETLVRDRESGVRTAASNALRRVQNIPQTSPVTFTDLSNSTTLCREMPGGRKRVTPREILGILSTWDPAQPEKIKVVVSAMDAMTPHEAVQLLEQHALDKGVAGAAATETLSWFGGQHTLDALARLSGDTNTEFSCVVQSLWQVGGANRMRTVRNLARGNNARARAVAALVLGHIATDEACAILRTLGQDHDPVVRLAAACGIAQIGGENAFVTLKSMTDDHDSQVRLTAYRALLTGWDDDVWGERAARIREKCRAKEKDAIVLEQLSFLGKDLRSEELPDAGSDRDEGK